MRLCWPRNERTRVTPVPGVVVHLPIAQVAHNRPLDARSAGGAKPSVMNRLAKFAERSGSPDLPSARIMYIRGLHLWCYKRFGRYSNRLASPAVELAARGKVARGAGGIGLIGAASEPGLVGRQFVAATGMAGSSPGLWPCAARPRAGATSSGVLSFGDPAVFADAIRRQTRLVCQIKNRTQTETKPGWRRVLVAPRHRKAGGHGHGAFHLTEYPKSST